MYANQEKIITVMQFHTVGFVFSQLNCRFSIHFHLLSPTPISFYTGGCIYPVQINIYKGRKILLSVKFKKHGFSSNISFFLLVNSDSSSGPTLLFLCNFWFWSFLVVWVSPDTFTWCSWQASWDLNIQLIVHAVKCSFFLFLV